MLDGMILFSIARPSEIALNTRSLELLLKYLYLADLVSSRIGL